MQVHCNVIRREHHSLTPTGYPDITGDTGRHRLTFIHEVFKGHRNRLLNQWKLSNNVEHDSFLGLTSVNYVSLGRCGETLLICIVDTDTRVTYGSVPFLVILGSCWKAHILDICISDRSPTTREFLTTLSASPPLDFPGIADPQHRPFRPHSAKDPQYAQALAKRALEKRAASRLRAKAKQESSNIDIANTQ